MPPLFTKYLADRLNQKCPLEVCEAQANDLLSPGKIYIAPGDFHMTTVMRGAEPRIALNQQAPENSCRPAVDVLFRSVAQCYGRNALACVLTGMGSDGLAGCHEIAKVGGHIIAQDQATSVVWGMPAVVTNAGLANQSLPLDSVASELRRHTLSGRPRQTLTSAGV
jgi:two-component system chemotaxis response regulator CheB